MMATTTIYELIDDGTLVSVHFDTESAYRNLIELDKKNRLEHGLSDAWLDTITFDVATGAVESRDSFPPLADSIPDHLATYKYDLEAIQRGLKDVEEGRVSSKGSFSQYVEDDLMESLHTDYNDDEYVPYMDDEEE